MSNIYMQIPGVEGNVTAKNYQGWIELDGVNFSITRNVNMRIGQVSDREATTPQFSEIEISKVVDSASNKLMMKSCGDKAIPEIDIHYCNSDTSSSPYMKIKLSNVLIGHYQNTGSKDMVSQEVLRLNFTKIQRTYLGRDKIGQVSAPDVVGYDLATAQGV